MKNEFKSDQWFSNEERDRNLVLIRTHIAKFGKNKLKYYPFKQTAEAPSEFIEWSEDELQPSSIEWSDNEKPFQSDDEWL